MKLSKIAITVVAALGLVGVGGSWYTGKLAEEKYVELVAKGNESLKQLASYGVEAAIKDVKFERGVFSSKVNYVLEAKMPETAQTIAFKGDDTVFHGPFPLNRLTKGNVVPVALSAETNIAMPEQLKAVIGVDTLLTGETNVGYAGNSSGNVALSAINYETISFSGATGTFDFDKELKGEVNFSVPKFVASSGQEIVEIKDLSYGFSTEEESDDNFAGLGDYTLKAGSYVIGSNESKMLLENLSGKGSSKVENGRIVNAGDLDTEISFFTNNQMIKLGKLSADISSDFDAKVVKSVQTAFENAKDPMTDNKLLEELSVLVEAAPVLNIKHLSLENEKGKLAFGLNLGFEPFKIQQLASLEQLLRVMKTSKLSFDLPVDALGDFLAKLNGMTDQAQGAKTSEMVENLLNQAKAVGLTESNDTAIKSVLEVDKGVVTLNGKVVPEEQVQMALWLLTFSLSQ